MAVGDAASGTGPVDDATTRLPGPVEDFVDFSLGIREALPPVDGLGLLGALGQVMGRPRNVARSSAALTVELARIGLGRTPVDYAPKDWRFANPAWTENPLFRRLGQSYLAWHEAMHGLIDD